MIFYEDEWVYLASDLGSLDHQLNDSKGPSPIYIFMDYVHVNLIIL